MENKNRLCCIYCIECLANGKRYIGQTVNFNARKYDHWCRLRHNKHSNDCLQKAWIKYGEHQFKIYVIRACEQCELDELEKYYIQFYNTLSHKNGYNIEGGGNGKKSVSQQTKSLISKHHAIVSGCNNPMYGVRMSEESINKTLNNLNYIQRKHRGEESHMCSITENDALAIKRYFSDGHIVRRGEITEIAKKYSTSTGIVSHIKNGHAWAWLSV